MNPTEILSRPELAENDRIMVIGLGFTGTQLYLKHLAETPDEHLVLVDKDADRLQQVSSSHIGATAFTDTYQAIEATAREGKNVTNIIVSSSTVAHGANLGAIMQAIDDGHLARNISVGCEKPVTTNEEFSEILKRLQSYPELKVSVGYILRFSETLNALQRHLTESNLKVTGLEWKYGKDRSQDSRPTQGVFPDEIVHPLSVTDLMLMRAIGEIIGVDVTSAEIERAPFTKPGVQEKAHQDNPAFPLDPTSDVRTTLNYRVQRDGTVVEIPVTINSSFRFEEGIRQALISVEGPNGPDTLILDFDKSMEGSKQTADVLTNSAGHIIYAWSGNKAAIQIKAILGIGESSDAVTSLAEEQKIQETLTNIGRVAATGVTRPE